MRLIQHLYSVAPDVRNVGLTIAIQSLRMRTWSVRSTKSGRIAARSIWRLPRRCQWRQRSRNVLRSSCCSYGQRQGFLAANGLPRHRTGCMSPLCLLRYGSTGASMPEGIDDHGGCIRRCGIPRSATRVPPPRGQNACALTGDSLSPPTRSRTVNHRNIRHRRPVTESFVLPPTTGGTSNASPN